MNSESIKNQIDIMSGEEAIQQFTLPPRLNSSERGTVDKIDSFINERPICKEVILLGISLSKVFFKVTAIESESKDIACQNIIEVLNRVLNYASNTPVQSTDGNHISEVVALSAVLQSKIECMPDLVGLLALIESINSFVQQQENRLQTQLLDYFPLSPRVGAENIIEILENRAELIRNDFKIRYFGSLSEHFLQTTYHCLIEWEPSFIKLPGEVVGNYKEFVYVLMQMFFCEQMQKGHDYQRFIQELYLRLLKGAFPLRVKYRSGSLQDFIDTGQREAQDLIKGEGIVFNTGGTISKNGGHATIFELECLRGEGENQYILRTFNTGLGHPNNDGSGLQIEVHYFPISNAQVLTNEFWSVIGNFSQDSKIPTIEKRLSKFGKKHYSDFHSTNIQKTGSCTIMSWWGWIEYHFEKSFGKEIGKGFYFNFRNEFVRFLHQTLIEKPSKIEFSRLHDHLLDYLNDKFR